jgi:FKBP-type peptidyl-prolyl cis-trans isomerase
LIEAGTGARHPVDNDRVALEYTSWSRDGKATGSSRVQGQPLEQSVRLLLPGLAAAVEAMVVGERRMVWIDGAQTCGEDDDGRPVCLGDATFDIKLVGLNPAPPVPDDLAGPPPTATPAGAGLALKVLAPGHCDDRPGPDSRVTIRHSGWSRDGVLFESTAMLGHPSTFVLHELPEGLREGIRLMSAGEKARFWIASAGPSKPRRRGIPTGPVVYDVELISFE